MRRGLAATISQLQRLHASTVSIGLRRFGKRVSSNFKSAMIFSPHQDDETLGCGGVIALKCRSNVPMQVVFLTDGGKAEMGDRSAHEVVALRQREAELALSILGVSSAQIHFLQQPDGELQTLSPTQQQAVVAQLTQLLQHYQPEEVYVPHRSDPHPDHTATYRLVKQAIDEAHLTVDWFEYPIWLFWKSPLFLKLQPADLAGACLMAIDPVQAQKQQAIAAYDSQCSVLPIDFLKQFRQPYEVFFKG